MKKTSILKKRIINILIYVLPVIYALVFFIFPGFLSSEPLFEDNVWIYTEPNYLYSFTVPIVIIAIVMFYLAFLLMRYLKKVRNEQRRKQIKLIIWGFLIALFYLLLTEALYALGVDFPYLAVSEFGIVCVFIGIAMWKYELFSLNVLTAAETILSTMSDTVILVNPDGEIIGANIAMIKLLGYKKEELIGKQIDSIFLKKEDEKDIFLKKIWKELEESKEITDFEISLKSKDGKGIPVSLSSSMVSDKRKKILGAVCIVRNISERKAMENKVKESMDELKRINKIMVGRELQMVKLKEENKKLKDGS
jgi:PAS domain S-box-containing protein